MKEEGALSRIEFLKFSEVASVGALGLAVAGMIESLASDDNLLDGQQQLLELILENAKRIDENGKVSGQSVIDIEQNRVDIIDVHRIQEKNFRYVAKYAELVLEAVNMTRRQLDLNPLQIKMKEDNMDVERA